MFIEYCGRQLLRGGITGAKVWRGASTWPLWLLTGININNVWHRFPATGKTIAEWGEGDQY